MTDPRVLFQLQQQPPIQDSLGTISNPEFMRKLKEECKDEPPKERVCSISFTFEGYKRWGLPSMIKRKAWRLNLDLEVHVETRTCFFGWVVIESAMFKATGPESKINELREEVMRINERIQEINNND